jgi:four helix bundle protein
VAESYRDLAVWNRAMQLCVALYRLTAAFPPEEMHGITGQLRQAGVAIASNIAEGSGRQAPGENKRLLGAARGAIMEVQTLLAISAELGFGSEEMRTLAEGLSNEVAKMLLALMARMG